VINGKYQQLMLFNRLDIITTISVIQMLGVSKMNNKEKIIVEIEQKIRKETVLFFDFDGTLVETNYANFLAYNKAINMVLNDNITYNPNERFTREKLIKIFPYLTKTQYENVIEKKEI